MGKTHLGHQVLAPFQGCEHRSNVTVKMSQHACKARRSPMALTTVSARDFARDFASAKKAANSGPVIVTDRGRPTYALLKIEDYY